MRLKSNNIQTSGIRPELLFAVMVADEVYTEHGAELVITSFNDGAHSLTSLHYAGCAFDCRTSNLGGDDYAKDVAEEIKQRLNIDYDVIFEGNHIHCEFQPRRR